MSSIYYILANKFRIHNLLTERKELWYTFCENGKPCIKDKQEAALRTHVVISYNQRTHTIIPSSH